MTEAEFGAAYEENEARLVSYITLHGGVDEDTAWDILHRAMFGRPTRTNGISAGMYGKRQEIAKADFLRYAYACVKIEIRDWHREHKRMVSFQDRAFQDKEGDWIPFDPSTHQGLDPVEHKKRPTCPPNLVACSDCNRVAKPQPTSTRGSLCSCGLGIPAGVEPRYRPPQGHVDEPQNWNMDEHLMVIRLDYRPWRDPSESAFDRLSPDHQELLRRLVIGERNVIHIVFLAGLRREDGRMRVVLDEKWADLGGPFLDSPRVGGVETVEAVAADWHQSPDVVNADLEGAKEKLEGDPLFLRPPRIDWRTGRKPRSWPVVPACTLHSLDKSSPGRDWLRCEVCGEICHHLDESFLGNEDGEDEKA